ncbi:MULTISPECIES: thioredoxin family protein [unclassified Pedobacter]|uniref:TlpA family protein disulfide reductase n=1 Tax=unclassified Pedobacter TaxID=2628915 RepID=UPI000B4B240C|nr:MULTISPECIES: thioredoxin family protein [unclassified Pedobacter]MCX2429741.1 thioredoxin family protein [Pedobacter sp. GR22-10]OWK70787.1 thiol reductase thioredoxin [Pedobacter sp. AJM]
MKKLFTIILIISAMNVSAQEINKKIHDQVHNKDILINACTRDGMVTFPEFKEMYEPLYAAYTPDAATMIELKKLVKKEKIKIVFGTWCGDSKVNVPNFLKIMDALHVKEKNIEFIAVDGNKKAENGIIDGLDIKMVPTFIIYDQKGIELGRIVEGPKTTLEGDLLAIYKKKS